MIRFALLALLFVTLPVRATDEAYPKPDLLVEPTAIAKEAKKFVVLDARSREKYAKGHVPGAVGGPCRVGEGVRRWR